MYKQYLNDYEKRAEQIRKAARAVETGKGENAPVLKDSQSNTHILENKLNEKFKKDDLLLLGLIFLLISGEEKDMTLIIILGYLFLCGI